MSTARVILRIFFFLLLVVAAWFVFDVSLDEFNSWEGNGIPFIFAVLFYLFLFRIDYKSSLKKKVKKQEYKASDEKKFNGILLSLIAHLLEFDANSKDAEFKFLEQNFLRFFSQDKTDHLMARLIKDHLNEKQDLEALCAAARIEFGEAACDQLVYILCGVITADKLITDKENALLQQIAKYMEFSKERLNSILKQFSYQTEEERARRQDNKEYYQQKEQQRQQQLKPFFSLERAYEILELPVGTDFKTVKKQYRKLALKYHPDRLTQLGEEHVKIGQEKFAKIAEAYDYLKSQLDK